MSVRLRSDRLGTQIIKRCPTTKARVTNVCLPHSVVETPIFMPVGTQGTMKGMRKSVMPFFRAVSWLRCHKTSGIARQ